MVGFKFGIMSEVYIQSDTLNVGLPVGEFGCVILINPHIFTAERYCVRLPNAKKTVWVVERDLADKETYLSGRADEVIRSSLVDYALETKNKELFEQQVKSG